MPRSQVSAPVDHSTAAHPASALPRTIRVAVVLLTLLCKSQAPHIAAADEPAPAPGEIRILPVEREKPQAATVRLRNGLSLSGMVSPATTLAPLPASGRSVDRIEQKLLMRLIHQGSREIYVPTRRTDPPVPDVNAWPAQSFAIPRTKQRRDVRPPILPQLSTFDELGIARGKTIRTNGESRDVTAAVTAINELYAVVTSSTHDWEYAVQLDAIPRQHLLSILGQVEDYPANPTRRLELARILMLADRLPEAGLLLQATAADFPQFADRTTQQLQQVREQLAVRITKALEERGASGQHQLASNGARLHPKSDLTPDTIVRVERLVSDYDEINRRIERLRQTLPALAAEFADPGLRNSAMEAVRSALAELDPDSIARMAAFELVQTQPAADRPSPEEQIAIALSGWLMGTDQTLQSLPETLQLAEARQLLLDFLATSPDSEPEKNALVDQLSKITPLTVERAAALVNLLPSPAPVQLDTSKRNSGLPFLIEPDDESLGGVGIAPPEYHETRAWPLLIAFPQPGGDPTTWLQWWQAQAEMHGWIVVVPRLESPDNPADFTWNASAVQHRRFLQLLRKLKLGLRVDDDRVFVAGHGFGGDAAMDVACSHPHLFAGIAAISSTGRKHIQWTAGNAIQIPWYVVLGDAHPLWFERMQILAAKLFRRGDEIPVNFDVMFIKYPNRGAESFHEEADDIFRWMNLHRRQKFPERIHARLLRSTDLDWGWIQLEQLPDHFAQLDPPSEPDADGFRPATLNASFSERNLLRVTAAPGDFNISFSPEFPNFDPARPIRIADGRKTRQIKFQPSLTDLLQHLHKTADRSRLCWMLITPDDK
jgi:pimeloyl-ACP methyl ester carboxylesterase